MRDKAAGLCQARLLPSRAHAESSCWQSSGNGKRKAELYYVFPERSTGPLRRLADTVNGHHSRRPSWKQQRGGSKPQTSRGNTGGGGGGAGAERNGTSSHGGRLSVASTWRPSFIPLRYAWPSSPRRRCQILLTPVAPPPFPSLVVAHHSSDDQQQQMY